MDKPLSLSGGVKAFGIAGSYLDGVNFSGSLDIYDSVRKMKKRGSGLTIIISDLMDERLVISPERQENFEKLQKLLAYNKQQAVFIHVLDRTEADPSFMGTHNLIDMENEKSRIRVTMDSGTVGEYKKAFDEFSKMIEKTSSKYQNVYVRAFTDEGAERIIFEGLREIYDI